MNFKKIFALSVCAIIAVNAFCLDNLGYSISVDAAYYPKSNYIAGPSHFAPLTGVYSGLEGRVTGSASYYIPTPLGDNWLLNSANIKLKANLEVTPVSIAPEAKVTFTPLPFLVFETGAKTGTGWNLAGLQGMAIFNGFDGYDDLTPFKSWYSKIYVQGTFQFDTGAIFAGDWTHVQLMYTYQAYYSGITGVDNGEVWMWQCSGNKTNGWQNYQSIVVAYQMPLVLSRVGVLTEIEGHYTDDYNQIKYGDYNGSFKSISISPLMQFNLPGNQSLAVLFGFSSRRSYVESNPVAKSDPTLTYAGREWFFNRIAFSWSYSF